MSAKQKAFIKKHKKKKALVIFFQFFIGIMFLALWEIAARYAWINTFITSYPTKVIETIVDLAKNNDLFIHIGTTVLETLVAFLITTIVSVIIAIIF